jgi:VWFA-related protein
MTRYPVLMLALVTLAAGGTARQKPTFSARTDAIQVDVLVTENGRPVRGLQSADFEVMDNGVLQRVDLTTFEQIPLNLVLAFDSSSSVKGARLEDLRAGGARLLDALRKRDRAALVTFSHVVTLDSPLTGNVEEMRGALRRVVPDGGTSLVDATHAAMMVGESDVGRSLALVFSDGLDTSSWLTPEIVLETERRTDVVVCGVSVAHTPDTFLRDITATTGGSLVNLDSTENLDQTFVRLLDEFRQRYLVTYSPHGVSAGGWHRLDVRIKGRRVAVKARPGYLAGGPAAAR